MKAAVLLDKSAVDALLSCTSKENSRPALNKVHFKGSVAEACNGHVAARIPLTWEGEPAEYEPLLLDRADFPKLTAKQGLRLEVTTRKLQVTTRDSKYGPAIPTMDVKGEPVKVAGVEETYPNVDQVWPDYNGDGQRFALSGEYLQKIAKMATGTSKRVNFTFAFADRALVMEMPGAERDKPWTALVMPLRLND